MNPKFLISLFSLMLFFSVSQAQSKYDDKTEQLLIRMVQGHSDALQKGDTSWLRNNFNDSYTYTNPLGMFINKDAAIHVLGSGAIKLESSLTEEIVAHVYGDCGIVTDVNTIKGSIGNMDISGKYRYLYVFANLNGRWQIVAEQGTSVRQ
jgi:ketosteroid isomerase-like protein